MAKPERHPWPYGPQWNYYPPHMLNFSKIPFSSGSQVNIDSNDNYLSIRCPEPRRPYQVPYSSFTSYYHQENHPVRSYLEANPVYPPKQYLYRPLCQENINSPYKVAENIQSYPACSNYPLTKDQSTCYQTTWNNTSHFQRNPPELDVRHFLATWQDKDDDFCETSTDNDQTQVYQGNDSIPLDCSKRNSNDKSIRKSYNDNFLNGPTLNASGYIVQPYYLKDDPMSLNRSVISEELNNNVLHRNNLNYENSHQSYQKNFYPNTRKFPTGKLLPCEHNMTYSQTLNHCDINSSHLRNSMNPPRQKDLVVDSSERSQYNLTSSLESGELFCDINPRHEEIPKPPVIHPMFNDNSHKMSTVNEQCYFGNENNEFSENLMLNDFAPLKDSWDMFSSNSKIKDNIKVSNNSKSVNKVSPQIHYEHLLSNNNNATRGNDNNTNLNNSVTSIAYEGAFNILPNLSSGNQSTNPHNSNSCVLQSHEPIKPNISSQSQISTKLPTNVTKPIQANTKIRPFQFNEEISSDDIDISIASSGDFLVEEDQPSLCSSVNSFSKLKKEKNNIVLQKGINKNDSYKVDQPYSCTILNNDSEKSMSLSNVEDGQKNKSNGFSKDTEFNSVETEKKTCIPENIISSAKSDVMDLSVLKTQNLKDNSSELEKDPMCYLDISNNYFNSSHFEQKTTELKVIQQKENEVPDISAEKCEIKKKIGEISDVMENSDKIIDESSVHESNFSTFDNALSHTVSPDKLLGDSNSKIPNDNLLLLAHCSQEYGGQIINESESSEDCSLGVNNIAYCENQPKTVRDSVIKCSLRWDKIFNIVSDEVSSQPDMSLDLGPAKVELRLPSDNCSSNHWKIVEADNKIQTSSIVKVKRLILKRKNQPEERIPKMIIKKTEGQEYRSYLKNESSKTVLHCEKLKIYCDKLSKSPHKSSDT